MESDNAIVNHRNNLYSGHRQRLREQFLVNGFSGMSDQNVLELLLFYSIPRRDTYVISDRLLEVFGSLERVLEASHEELIAVDGISDNSACLIEMVLPIFRRYNECMLREKRCFLTAKEMAEYLRTMYVGMNTETVLLLCFDARMRLINCRTICEGSLCSAGFDMRKVVETAISQKASYVVLSHNHPHGIAAPSASDLKTTFLVAGMLRAIKIRLTDHIIISYDDYYAMSDDEQNRKALIDAVS